MPSEQALPISRAVPITVQRVKAGSDDRHSGTLVGNIQKDYLIITGLKDVELEIGEHLIVRMVWQSAVSGYQTTVRGVIDAPVRLYVIAYPERVETVNLRKSERLKVFLPANVRAQVGSAATSDVVLVNGMLLDISAGGCCFSSKRPVQPSSTITISFCFPGETHVHMVTGLVLTSFGADRIYAQRVRWISGGKDLPELAEIRKWIEQHLAYALLSSSPSLA
jgi:hypothetical protein